MLADEYQDFTNTTAIYPTNVALPYVVCGLVGEAGEAADKLQKVVQGTLDSLPKETENLDNLSKLNDLLKQASTLGKEIEAFKKGLRKSLIKIPELRELTPEEKDAMDLELGDSAWYISQGARYFKKKLSEILQKNINKLSSRKDRGVLHGSGDYR